MNTHNEIEILGLGRVGNEPFLQENFGTLEDKKNPHMEETKQTSNHISEDLWADAEFYFYGMLVNAGGNDKANIHLQTQDYGLITISTEKEFLKELEYDILHKQFRVRAKGLQSITTGAIDLDSLHLLELTPYKPEYDEDYLAQLIKRASQSWKDVDDVDQWLSEIRGTNE